MMKATTLVLGASTDPTRYAHQAILKLRRHGHAVVAIGLRSGLVADVPILLEWPSEGIHTVTLYLDPLRQPAIYDKIITLRPQRVIFNPGTENSEFFYLLNDAGIEVAEACTLVMLSAGTY